MLVGCTVTVASGWSTHADSNVNTSKHNKPLTAIAGESGLRTLITLRCVMIIVISITYGNLSFRTKVLKLSRLLKFVRTRNLP